MKEIEIQNTPNIINYDKHCIYLVYQIQSNKKYEKIEDWCDSRGLWWLVDLVFLDDVRFTTLDVYKIHKY